MKFYNPGKYTHPIGRDKETGDMKTITRSFGVAGQEEGAIILNFPGHQFRKTVKAGDWVDIPEDMFAIHQHAPHLGPGSDLAKQQTIHAVKSMCAALLTEDEFAALPAAEKPAKPKKE